MQDIHEELLYRIAITMLPQVGAITAKNLISYCGGAKAVFEARGRHLKAIPRVGSHIARSILQQSTLKQADNEVEYIRKNNISTFYYLDEAYPHRLKHLPDCPVILYFRGKVNFNEGRTVAIVGTRSPSPRGREVCKQFIRGLQPQVGLLVSGLAFGIDITAHRSALELNFPNVGVVGHGLKHLYPAAHRKVAERMLTCGGLLTEFPSQTKPDGRHFPMRNRIIAGLVDLVIVIETARRGGSVITANLANEYDRDVFAVPGRISDEKSAGCNELIKSHKANLVEGPEDVAYFMNWQKKETNPGTQRKLFVNLDEEEAYVLKLMEQQEFCNIDFLLSHGSLSVSRLSRVLLGLEFKGLIKVMPGNKYILA